MRRLPLVVTVFVASSFCQSSGREWLCFSDYKPILQSGLHVSPIGSFRLAPIASLEKFATVERANFADFDVANGTYFVAEYGANCIRIYANGGAQINFLSAPPSGSFDFGRIESISVDTKQLMVYHTGDAEYISLLTLGPITFRTRSLQLSGSLYGNVRVGCDGELYAHGTLSPGLRGSWVMYASSSKVFRLSADDLSIRDTIKSINNCLSDPKDRLNPFPDHTWTRNTLFDLDSNGTLYYCYESFPIIYIGDNSQRRSFFIHREDADQLLTLRMEKLRVDPKGKVVICQSITSGNNTANELTSVFTTEGKLIADIDKAKAGLRKTEAIVSFAFDKTDGQACLLTLTQRKMGDKMEHLYRVYRLKLTYPGQ